MAIVCQFFGQGHVDREEKSEEKATLPVHSSVPFACQYAGAQPTQLCSLPEVHAAQETWHATKNMDAQDTAIRMQLPLSRSRIQGRKIGA